MVHPSLAYNCELQKHKTADLGQQFRASHYQIAPNSKGDRLNRKQNVPGLHRGVCWTLGWRKMFA